MNDRRPGRWMAHHSETRTLDHPWLPTRRLTRISHGLSFVSLLGLSQAVAQTSSTSAQRHEPVLTALYPPGVTIGETTQWMLRGRNLDDITQLRISGAGVEVLKQEMTADGRLAVSVRTLGTAAPGIRTLRVDGPSGLSNLVLFRVDTLRPFVESEPNDAPAHADDLELEGALSGILGDRDVDHVRIKGRSGSPVTVEVEASRLGSPVRPVVTLLDGAGRSLIQGRETPGLEGDCRVTARFPNDGIVIIRVQDALYQGGDSASYRLRVFTTPFATALFPLGGPRGESIDVWLSGGTLDVPVRQRIVLPDRPGTLVELEPFDGPGGPLVVAHRLAVGEGPDLIETQMPHDSRPGTRLLRGTTVNGRIEMPGGLDCYRVVVRRGERIRVGIQAASLGSWLDSVVTIRDEHGRRIADNDDPAASPSLLANAWSLGRGAFPTDSVLVQQAESDGEWLIEVADRYGHGGAEFGYRLTVEPSRPDFLVTFQPGREGGDSGVAPKTQGLSKGPEWVLNLAPGSTRRQLLKIAVEGRVGSIQLQATGLPPGVTAAPVTIRPERESGRAPAGSGRRPNLTAELVLQVADDADPAVGELTVTATSPLPDGSTLTRVATVWVPLGLEEGTPPGHRVFRELNAVPVKVLDRPKSR